MLINNIRLKKQKFNTFNFNCSKKKKIFFFDLHIKNNIFYFFILAFGDPSRAGR